MVLLVDQLKHHLKKMVVKYHHHCHLVVLSDKEQTFRYNHEGKGRGFFLKIEMRRSWNLVLFQVDNHHHPPVQLLEIKMKARLKISYERNTSDSARLKIL